MKIHGVSQRKIRYLMQNVLLHRYNFFPTGAHYHWFIWRHIKSNNFKNYLPPKVSERATLPIFMTLESTVSPANFHPRFPTVLKGICHRSRTQSMSQEDWKGGNSANVSTRWLKLDVQKIDTLSLSTLIFITLKEKFFSKKSNFNSNLKR